MKRTRKGFTLIELLVVIAIIAILAAILFPVFAKARERAQQTACLSNTKQIGLAMMQYLDDYNGAFPVNSFDPQPLRTRLWPFLLMPYAKTADIFKCPSHAGKPNTTGKNNPEMMFYTGWSVSNGPVPATPARDTWYTQEIPGIGYAFNEFVIGIRDVQPPHNYIKHPRRRDEIKSPADVGIFGDGTYLYCLWNPVQEAGQTVWYWYRGKKGADDYYGWPQHNGGNNFVFADGHAAYDKPTGGDTGPGYYPKVRVW
jgi:prepilin-type N-terminal cleavage/methylation domain-containing protein/prepilin-type processing-associated H-X9-DG protein